MIVIKSKPKQRRRRSVCFAGALFLVYTLTVFFVGFKAHREGVFSNVIRPWIQGNSSTLSNYLAGMGANPEQLRIDIKFKHLETLRAQRDRALNEGSLFASTDDLVPATISFADGVTPVRIRLKGDGVQHLLGDKWSFRVSVRREGTLFGMKQFSLQHPGTRNYIYEWLYHKALQREGVIALRYKFVEVSLNGKDLGVYALEEHFEKRLVENNRRREGPIVRFDEDAMWREITDQMRPFGVVEDGQSGSYTSSKVDGFQSGQLLSGPDSAKRYGQIVQRMEGFRSGRLATGDVFDVELLGKYFAIVDLLGAEHGSRWHNIRFYCNPVTTRLEPVGFDANAGRPIERLIGMEWEDVRQKADAARRNESFRGRLFADPLLRRAYVKHLERVSEESYADQLLADLSEELGASLKILYREWPQEPWGAFNVLKRNQAYIRTMLEPSQVVSAGLQSVEGNLLTLEVGNLQSLAVEVTALVLPGRQARVAPVAPVELLAKWHGHSVTYQTIQFELPADVKWDHAQALEAKVVCRIDGAQAERLEPIAPFSVVGPRSFGNDLLRRSPNAHRFDFVEVDREQRLIRFKPGRWSIHQDVIVPAGYRLVIGPATTLDLVDRAMLLSYSALDCQGTAEQPVVIMSSDGTGQGLVVMEAPEESKLSHVRFEELKYPKRSNWSLTGSVTFYESPLVADHCAFVSNQSEDGLNTVRTHFALSNCLFDRSASDAFDADFCTGSVEDTRFLNIGNDGVDVSGSVVSVKRVAVHGSGDKAISSGEASDVTAEDLDVRDAVVGLASKDRSSLTVTGATLRGCTYPVVAFQKKPEFGPAVVDAKDVEVIDAKGQSLVQAGSKVTLNGAQLVTKHVDILGILYAEEKRRDF
jgi:hypothetical protein